MMKDVEYHAGLTERNGLGEFGSHLLHVPALLEWLKAKRLHLKTMPPIEDYPEFVQVEWLLNAVRLPFQTMDFDEAAEIVANDPGPDPRTAPRYELGRRATQRWREVLAAAIDADELVLLDFATKMPVRGAAAVATKGPGLPAAERDEKMLADREKWQSTGKAAKDWDKKFMEQTGLTASNLKARLRVARLRRKKKKPGPASPWSV